MSWSISRSCYRLIRRIAVLSSWIGLARLSNTNAPSASRHYKITFHMPTDNLHLHKASLQCVPSYVICFCHIKRYHHSTLHSSGTASFSNAVVSGKPSRFSSSRATTPSMTRIRVSWSVANGHSKCFEPVASLARISSTWESKSSLDWQAPRTLAYGHRSMYHQSRLLRVGMMRACRFSWCLCRWVLVYISFSIMAIWSKAYGRTYVAGSLRTNTTDSFN